jgi:hypothetical protein
MRTYNEIDYLKKNIKKKKKLIAYFEVNGGLLKGTIANQERRYQIWELWALETRLAYIDIKQPLFVPLTTLEKYKKYTVLLAAIYIFPGLKDKITWIEREDQGKKWHGVRIAFSWEHGTLFRVYENELQDYTLLTHFFRKQARILL